MPRQQRRPRLPLTICRPSPPDHLHAIIPATAERSSDRGPTDCARTTRSPCARPQERSCLPTALAPTPIAIADRPGPGLWSRRHDADALTAFMGFTPPVRRHHASPRRIAAAEGSQHIAFTLLAVAVAVRRMPRKIRATSKDSTRALSGVIRGSRGPADRRAHGCVYCRTRLWISEMGSLRQELFIPR